jgi:fatty acid desaturase
VNAALHDLQKPTPAIYWADLLGSATAGWGAFAVACVGRDAGTVVAAGLLATILLYRAHLFIHELSHAARRLRGFTTVWNIMAGFPLLVPSSFAVGVHAFHHRPDTYGTAEDPEYLPFARSRALIVRFVLVNFAFPWLMALRFLVAGPVALLAPSLQRYLERHASSLAMNSAFVREVSAAQHRSMLAQQVGLLLVWIPLVALLWTGVWPLRVALCWIVVATGIALMNGIRTLAAHHYRGDGSVFDREGQRADSIDIPGAWWTTIWAPVGHRYHALHHYAPGLPYHNLGAAYRRLAALQTQSGDAPADASGRNLPASLTRLWSAAGTSRGTQT